MKEAKRDQTRTDELRKRAEEGLLHKMIVPEELSDKDARRWIHELQMQNEELRKARAELEESRARYSDLYDFAPVGYLTIDGHGLILEANLTALRELGVERSLLINKPVQAYIVVEDRDIFFLHLREVFKSTKRQTCEIRLQKRSGIEVYAQLESIGLKDSNGDTVCRTSIIDITDRKRAEEALQESEDKYRAIFDNALVGLFRARTADGKLLECNDRFAHIVGYDKREACCAEFVASRQYVDPGTRERLLAIINEAGQVQNFEARLRRQDNAVIWVRYSGRLNREKSCIEGVLTDITEEKLVLESLARVRNELEQRAQERTAELVTANELLTEEIAERRQTEEALQQSERQLRLLSSRLLTAQENERKRIARELHDSIGNSLTGIKFGLDKAFRQLGCSGDRPGVEALEAVMLMVRQAIQEARRIQTDLRPPLLDDLGIAATISWFCGEFEKLYSGIRVEKHISIEEKVMTEALQIVIFRILQEALNNVSKYAKADLVRVSIRERDSKIELAIEDNGVGFDVEHVKSVGNSGGGFGLTTMKERTELSGGSFSIKSTKGTGTIVRASWQC